LFFPLRHSAYNLFNQHIKQQGIEGYKKKPERFALLVHVERAAEKREDAGCCECACGKDNDDAVYVMRANEDENRCRNGKQKTGSLQPGGGVFVREHEVNAYVKTARDKNPKNACLYNSPGYRKNNLKVRHDAPP